MTPPRKRALPSRIGGLDGPDPEELERLFERYFDGAADPGLLAALARAEQGPLQTDLLVAGAKSLRARAVPVDTPSNRPVIDVAEAEAPEEGVPDVCAAAALLVACCDGTVAKHGVGPRGGGVSAYEALGVPIDLAPRAVPDALEWCGFAFLPPSRYRTSVATPADPPGGRVLRLLPLLANPAAPDRVLVGVSDPSLTQPLARALGRLGAERALVVTTEGRPWAGGGETTGHLWSGGRITSYQQESAPAALEPRDAAGQAAALRGVFAGEGGPLAEVVAHTAATALWVGGVLPSQSAALAWARTRLRQRIDLAPFREIR